MAENIDFNNQDPKYPIMDLPGNSAPGITLQQHEDITDALRFASMEIDPNSKIDPDTIRFIESQAQSINTESGIFPTRFNSPYPGNVSPNRNPFANQTGQMDLSTSQGRKDFLGGIADQVNTQHYKPHGGQWQSPIVYGKKQRNLDRYMSHSSFQDLGFHPYFDNETFYNQNSTWKDDLSRTSSSFMAMFKPAFTSGWRSLGDFISGNGFATDHIGAEAMRDSMRIAGSTRGGVTGFLNDLYLNSSYTFGIVSSMFVEEAALGLGTTGVRHLSKAINAERTAGQMKRTFDLLDGVGQWGRNAGNYSWDFMKSMAGKENLKKFYNFTKGNSWGPRNARWLVSSLAPETVKALQSINSTKNSAKNLSNLSKLNKTFGGFYRDVRMFNIAWAESKMEGGLVEIENVEKYYKEAVKEYGEGNIPDWVWEEIRAKSKAGGLVTSLINFPIIFLSNRLVLDGALRGFKPLGRLLQDTQASIGKGLMRTAKAGVTKSGKKAFENVGTGLKRMYKEGVLGGAKAMGGFALKYTTKNFAEGFQELAQEATSAGVSHYYSGLYDQIIADSINMNEAELLQRKDSIDRSFSSKLNSLQAGLNAPGVSFHTFMSGFLMGGMIQPFQTMMFEHMPNAYRYVTDREAYKKYALKKEEYLKKATERMEKMWADPANYLNITKLNALNQRQLNQWQLLSNYNNDINSFKDIKDQAIFHEIYTMLELNKAGDFKAHIQALLEMNDTELADAYSDTEASPKEIRKRFDGIIEKIDQIQDNYNKFNDKYINPFNSDDYEEGTKIWAQERIREAAWQHAKLMFLFTKNTYDRSIERMNSIMDNLSIDPVVDKIAANDIAALTSRKGILAEMQMLRDETKVPPAKNASKELKEQYKNKKEKLSLLENFADILYTKDEKTGYYKKSGTTTVKVKNEQGEYEDKQVPTYTDKMTVKGRSELRKAFMKLLNHIAKTSDGRIQDKDGVDKALDMIIDHKALNGRASDYWKAYQVLDDPKVLNDVAQRSAEAINKIWKEGKKKYNIYKKFKYFADNQERAKIITDLARRGIYAEAKEAEIFIKSGVKPTSFYSDQSRLNALTSEEDPKAWKTLTAVFQSYAKQKQAEEELNKNKVSDEIDTKEEEIEKGGLTAGDEFTDDEGAGAADTEERDYSINPNQKGRIVTSAMYQKFVNEEPGTLKILRKLHKQYEYDVNELKRKDLITLDDGSSLGFSQWVEHPQGGMNITKARYKAFSTWTMHGRKGSFEQFLKDNASDAWLVNIAKKHGLSVSDMMEDIIFNEKKAIDYGLKGDEEVIDTGEDYSNAKIKLVKKTVYNKDTNSENISYQVLTLDNENSYDKYKGLPKAEDKLQYTYKTEELAMAAMDWLRYNIPNQETFDFITEGKNKESFTTGETIVDKAGKKYIVRSKGHNVDRKGNLWVEPLGGGKNIFIPKGKFKTQGWTRASEEKLNIAGERVSKLPILEPVQIYPYDALAAVGQEVDKDYKATLLQNMQDTLQKLTQEDKDGIEVRIERNEEFSEKISEIPVKFGTFKPNKQLRKGSAKYNVVLYLNDKPFAVVSSPYSTTLLDKNNNEIDPLTITKKQASELFMKAVGSEDAHLQIRKNYAAAYAIEEIIEELLKKSASENIVTTIADLKKQKVDLLVGNGKVAYKDESGKNAISKIDELRSNGFTLGEGNDVNGSPLFIVYDQKKSVNKAGFTQSSPPLHNFPLKTEKERQRLKDVRTRIQQSMARQGFDIEKQMGRYVTFVFSPGIGTQGEYTAVELKTEQKNLNDVNNLIVKIKNQMADTKANNISAKTDTQDETTKNPAYNWDFNDKEIKDQLFIAGESGQQFELTVTEFGNLLFKYRNTNLDIDWSSMKVSYTPQDLNTITDGKDGVIDALGLFKHIQQDINKLIEQDKNIANKDVKGLKINLVPKNTLTRIRESLPKVLRLTYQELNNKTNAIIEPYIRTSIRSSFIYNDPAKIQATIQAAVDSALENQSKKFDSEPTDSQANESIEGKNNTQKFIQLAKDNFKNVPKSILQDIATKLEANDNDLNKLTKRERAIAESPIPASEISEMILDIKRNKTSNETQKKVDNSEKQKELSDEASLIEELKALERNIYLERMSIRELPKLKDGSNNPDYVEDEVARIDKAMADVELDPSVMELKDKIDELNRTNWKILSTDFDGRDVEKLNIFDDFLKANLPAWISREEISEFTQASKNNGFTAGAFLMNMKTLANNIQFTGTIYTSEASPFKYHEAFHAVFRLLLNDNQITKFLEIGKKGKLAQLKKEKKSIEKALEELRVQSPTYSEMTDKQLKEVLWEEWLADEFDTFKMNPKKSTVPSEVKSWFNKVIEWIMSIFEKTNSAIFEEDTISIDPELSRLFQDIDSGKFKTAGTHTENRFSQRLKEDGGVSTPAWAIIPQDIQIQEYQVREAGELVTKKRKIVIPFPADEVDMFVKQAAGIYTSIKSDPNYIDKDGNSYANLPKAEQIRASVKLLTDMYGPDNKLLRKRYAKNYEKLKELQNRYKSLVKFRKDFIAGVRDFVNIVDSINDIFENEFDVVEQEENATAYNINEKRNQLGGFRNTNEMIRMFIMSTLKDVKDQYGNTVVNPSSPADQQIPLRASVDYIKVFNGLLKSLAGKMTQAEQLKKMYIFAQSNDETKMVVNRFFEEFFGSDGPNQMARFMAGESSMPSIRPGRHKNFFQNVMKGFKQFRVDYIIGLKDSKFGNTDLIAANKQDDEHWQLSKWSSEFDRLRSRIQEDISKGSINSNILSFIEELQNRMMGDKMSDSELRTAGKEYSNKFRDLLGIDVSPLFIEYSILKSLSSGAVGAYQIGVINGFKQARPITLKDSSNASDLTELYESLTRFENIYNQEDNEDFSEGNTKDKVSNYAQQTGSTPDGVYYRLQKWAIANAAFDETVGSTVMLDPKGNYIYSHQTPTYHLEIAERMNSVEGIDKLREESPELLENVLLTDPKFRSLSDGNKLRILRSLGTRTTSFVKTQDGRKVENKSLDSNTQPGKTFGEFTPSEMIANIINMYTLHFNDLKGSLETGSYYDEVSKRPQPFAYAPILIRVLSESNIADYQNMPILKVLEGMNEDGTPKFSKEYLSRWMDQIKKQYNRIKEETKLLRDDEKGSKIHKGYNDATSLEQIIERDSDIEKDRAYKFNFEVADLLTVMQAQKDIVELEEEAFKGKKGRLTNEEVSNLEAGLQKVFLKKSGIKRLTSRAGSQGTVRINEKDYIVTHQGQVTRDMLSDEQLIQLKDDLGLNIIQEEYSKKAGFVNKLTIAGTEYYSKVKQIAEFFNSGDITFHKIKVVDEVTAKNETIEDTIDRPVYDNDLLKYLQNKAREEDAVNFEKAMKEYRSQNGLSAEEFIIDALNSQYDRFNNMLNRSGAVNLIDKRVKNGFVEFDDGTRFVDKNRNKNARDAQRMLNLTDNSDHNLRQIFFSNWQNTTLLNQLYLGNQAISLKDAIDAIKRSKAQNAGHKSADSIINAPEYGIENPVGKFGALMLSDPIVRKIFDVEGRSQKPGERTDGQIYMTTKAFIHFWFGLGNYNDNIHELMKKIQKGEKVLAEEFFGQVGQDTPGFKSQKSWINSKKMVYMDGEVYLKFSGTVLTKNLDSHNDGTPLESRKELYNLRVALENYEQRTGKFMIAVPESASKMRKTNILSPEMTTRLFNGELTIAEEELGLGEVFDETGRQTLMTKDGAEIFNSVETLDAHWMRLQQVSPSNKIEIVDPRQIKNLILSEQDDATIVNFMGEDLTIGQIKDMYEFSVSNRVELNYLDRTSLIFNIPNAFEALEKSIELNEATPDLEAFLDYAKAALETSQSSTQLMEFFEKENRQSKYELNNPITVQKYTELIMSFFSKGVMSEKQPGKAVTLISDFGMNVIKVVDAVDENKTPIAWTVIRTEDWKLKSRSERLKNFVSNPEVDGNQFLSDEKTPNPNYQNFINMEVGQIYSDRLRHDVVEYKRDKNGKLKRDKEGNLIEGELYSEFILPPHFVEEMNLKPGESIPEVIAKQFGVRIPSQDKHSAVNLKLVDHLPVEYGSSGVFAQELIEIAGWDFDIDKVYIQHKEFYEKDGKLIEYGKAKKLEDQFEEYMMNSEKEMNKQGSSLFYAFKKWRARRRREDSEIEKSEEDVKEEFRKWALTSPEALLFKGPENSKRAKQEFVRLKREETGKDYRYDFSADEFSPIYKELDTAEKLRKAAKGALNILGLPVTKADYKNFREENKKIYKTADGNEITLYREPYAAAYSNNILDFKYAMLGNESMAKPQDERNVAIKNEPATDEPFAKYWKLWNKPFEEGGLPNLYEKNRVDRGFDPNNPLGQWKFFKDSKEGARNISAVVPANTVLNWHKQWGTKLRTKNSDGTPISVPRLNGHKYADYGISFFIDPKTGEQIKDGDRIQYAMSALISIMVDNGKNPYSAKFGLNKHATGMAANMLALGIQPETILLLLNHPTIADAYYRGLNKTGPKDKGFFPILNDLYNNFKKNKPSEFENSLKIMVTNDMLREHANELEQIKQEVKSQQREMPEGMEIQEMAIIREWLNIANIKNYNDNIIGISQLQSGMGRDLESIKNTETNINELSLFDDKGFVSNKDDYNKTIVPFDYDFVSNITNPKALVGTNLRIFNQFSKKVLPKVLTTASKPFEKVSNVMFASLHNRMNFETRQTAQSKIRKDLLSYLTIKAYMNHLDLIGQPAQESLQSLNNSLIYDQIGDSNSIRINKVIADIRKELDENGEQNEFINEYISNQKVNTQVNQSGYNRIKPRPFVNLTPHQKNRIQSSLLELLDGNKFPKSRSAVKHIVHYLMVAHGLQKRGTSFVDIIPPILLDSYLQQAKRVRDLLARESVEDGSYVNVFGMTLDQLGEDFLKWFEASDDSHYVPQKKMKGVRHSGILDKQYDITSSVAGITRRILENPKNENKLYVISDSMEQDGISELEAFRNYPNVFSIPVKVAKGEFFTDEMYDTAIEEIDKAILEIENNLEGKLSIVFPLEGIGYGPYYKLNDPKAKKILGYLNTQLKEKFGYNNKTKKSSASVDKSTRGSGPMVMADDPVLGNKFIIDVNKGAKDQKVIWIDGKRVRVKLSKWKKDGVRWANARTIENAGWEYLSLPELNMRLIKFVPYFDIEVYDPKTKKTEVRSYKLDRLYTPYTKGNSKVSNTLFSVDNINDALYGTRAEYIQVSKKRSKKQWKGGFMFDINQVDGKTQELTYNEIVQAKKEAKKKPAKKGYTVPNTDNLGEPSYAPKNPVPRDTTPITNTKIDKALATSDGISYTDKEGNNIGNTSNDSVENIKEKNLVAPKTATFKGGKFVESKVEGNEPTIKKEDLKSKDVNESLDYAELEEWWYSTEVSKVKKAAEGMNLEGATLKDFIKAFEKAKEFTTLQRFIERIKDCY